MLATPLFVASLTTQLAAWGSKMSPSKNHSTCCLRPMCFRWGNPICAGSNPSCRQSPNNFGRSNAQKPLHPHICLLVSKPIKHLIFCQWYHSFLPQIQFSHHLLFASSIYITYIAYITSMFDGQLLSVAAASRQRQAAEVFRQGQQQLRKAQAPLLRNGDLWWDTPSGI